MPALLNVLAQLAIMAGCTYLWFIGLLALVIISAYLGRRKVKK